MRGCLFSCTHIGQYFGAGSCNIGGEWGINHNARACIGASVTRSITAESNLIMHKSEGLQQAANMFPNAPCMHSAGISVTPPIWCQLVNQQQVSVHNICHQALWCEPTSACTKTHTCFQWVDARINVQKRCRFLLFFRAREVNFIIR